MDKENYRKSENYFFLSRCFAGKITLEDLENYLKVIQEVAPQEGEFLYKIMDLIEGWMKQENIDLELPREYTRLFVLPEGVKPYESVYRGEEIRLMQDPWVEVKNFYKKKGWQMENSIYPEDHAAVELSFMGHLVAAGEEEDVIDFFRQHIANWIPDLMKDIMNNQNANLYKKWAEYGLDYIESEDKFYKANSLNKQR